MKPLSLSFFIQESIIFIWLLIFIFYAAKLIWKLRRLNSVYLSLKHKLTQKLLVPTLIYLCIKIYFDKIDLSIVHEVSLSTREYAFLTWFIVLLIWIINLLWKKKKIESLYSLLKNVLALKLLVPALLYFLWFTLGVLLFHIGIWEFSYLKTSFLWFFSEAFVIFYTVHTFNKTEKLKLQIKSFIWKSLSISALVSVFINLYTFNYFIELVLVLFFFISSLFITFIKHFGENSKLILGCFEIIISLIILSLLLFSLINFVSNFDVSKLSEVLIEYILLILFSIWVIPAVYIIRIYAIYELIWLKLHFFKYIPKKMKNIIKDSYN